MIHVIKIILFLITNAIGFYTTPVIINLAVLMGRLPDVAATKPEAFETFQFLLLSMSIPVWGMAALASIGYFLATGSLRPWLILAPIYVPAIYEISVITYFHFI